MRIFTSFLLLFALTVPSVVALHEHHDVGEGTFVVTESDGSTYCEAGGVFTFTYEETSRFGDFAYSLDDGCFLPFDSNMWYPGDCGSTSEGFECNAEIIYSGTWHFIKRHDDSFEFTIDWVDGEVWRAEGRFDLL